MKTTIKKLTAIVLLILMVGALAVPALAADAPEAEAAAVEETDSATSSKAFAAALCVGLAAVAGAIAMGWAVSRSVEGISRQPEAEGKIRTSLMLGLVLIETLVIYALIVAILVIFVL